MSSLLRQLFILSLAFTSVEAWAQPSECFEGQYLLEVSPIRPLRALGIQEATDASAGVMKVAEEHPRVVMLTRGGKRPGRTRVSADLRGGVCKQLTRKWRAKRKAKQRVRVTSCVCNGVLRPASTPNDTYYSLQWGVHQASDIDIDAPEAWGITTGSDSIVMGVIDSGIDYNHPDLNANIWVNPGEVPNNGIDDDGNGYIDDVYGLNAITYTASNRLAGDPMDDQGHGTHVAGTIGAVSNNNRGVAGVAHRVKMVAIKFLDAEGNGSFLDALEAIDYATNLKQRGVRIIGTNNSWGGGGYWQPLRDAIARSRAADMLFIAAAGNSSVNADVSPMYPAAYQEPNIISVASIDRFGALSSFSNYGAVSVDIGAPGSQIASTYPGNGYVYLSGTSMASPHVAGAFALLKAYSYGLSWESARNAILSSGDDLGALNGKTATGKLLNVHRMLLSVPYDPVPPPGQVVPTPTPTITPTPSPTPTPQPTPTIAPGNWDIGGKVTFEGSSLSGVRLELAISGQTIVRMSDSNGNYSFSDIQGPAAYTLSPSRSGYAFTPISGFLAGNTTHQISATSRSFTLTVQVLTPERAPVGGVSVNAGAFGNSTTDSQGRAAFQVPARHNYQLALQSSTHSLVETTLSGTMYGDTTRVAIARH